MTERFDYRRDPRKLCRFFYLVAQMSDTQLGWDPSVRRLQNPGDRNLVATWDRAVARLDGSHHIAQRLTEHTVFESLIERYIVEVNADSPEAAKRAWTLGGDGSSRTPSCQHPRPRQFLIGRCEFSHRSHTGRGTRGFIALDVAKKKFVFMKDSWRVDYANRDGKREADCPAPEMVIYGELYEKKVSHIPRIACGGDAYRPRSEALRMQRTIHHRYLEDVRPRIHTRLVFADVGRKLIDYKDSRELVTVMRDAILGMVLLEWSSIFGTHIL